MQFVDANEELAQKAQNILEHEEIELSFEVLAEVVYGLEGVYQAERTEIREGISGLLKYPNIHSTDEAVLKKAFQIFSEHKLDFVDALLIGYKKIHKAKVFSFDKKVNKFLYEPVE